MSTIFSRHEKYVTQYRAVFVVNCKIGNERPLCRSMMRPKRSKRKREAGNIEVNHGVGEIFKHVCCIVCSTEVGVIDEDEVYHFFNVLPSEP